MDQYMDLKINFYMCYEGTFCLHQFSFSYEASSTKERTKSNNNCFWGPSVQFYANEFLRELIDRCFIIGFLKSVSIMTSHNLRKIDYLLLPKKGRDSKCYSGASPHNIPLSMNSQRPSFHWYWPMFEVKEIYAPTRGASVKFLPLQSEYINT